MKRLLAIILLLTLLFAFAACGDDAQEKDDGKTSTAETTQMTIDNTDEKASEDVPEDVLDEVVCTKTLAYFRKFLSGGEYTMEMKTTAEGMTVTMKSAFKGDMMYSESDMDGTKSIMVMKDGYQYIIDHNAKTVIKMQVLNDAAVMDMFSDEAANYETAAASGTMEYNGKEYFYEEFNVEGEMIKYLFDGDDLKVMKATVMDMESTVEVVSLKKGADAKLFEIPADYQEISY